MHANKNIIFIVLVCLLFVFFGAGCAGDEVPPDEAVPDDEPSPDGADRPFAFVSWGGSFGDNIEEYGVKPWAEEHGIEYNHISPTDYGQIRAMIETGIIEWDVVDGDGFGIFLVPQYDGLEELDFDIIDTTGIPDEFVHDHGIYLIGYSTVMAWNTNTFGPGEEPQDWADFWDVENFPGTRALYDSGHHNIEIALLADGMAIDEVYPITEEKIDRAFNKLDEIKEHTVFWDAGALPPQMLADGEVAMSSGWNGRFDVVIDEGAPVAYTYNQGVLGYDAIFVIKGTPYYRESMELVNNIMSAEVQADICSAMPYGPINLDAFDYLDEDYGQTLPTYPDNLVLQVYSDDEWWGDNYEAMEERFLEWKVQ